MLATTTAPGRQRAPVPHAFRYAHMGFSLTSEKFRHVVVVQNILPVVRHVKIFKSVVVVIADANALPPSGIFASPALSVTSVNVPVIVVIEMIRRRFLPPAALASFR